MTPANLGLLVTCSVRYALGRQSYVVGDVIVLVQEQWPALTASDRHAIERDVRRYLRSTMEPSDIARAWRDLCDWMEGQIADAEKAPTPARE